MKKGLIIVVILLVLVGGYLGRKQIKSMFGMGTPKSVSMQPAATTNTTITTNTSAMQAAPSDNIYLTKSDAKLGKYMTDFQGMTVYTFDKDTAGVSNCYNGCAKAWPVYTSGATAEKTLPAN